MDQERKEELIKNSQDIVKCLNDLKIAKKDVCQALCIVLGNAFKITCNNLDLVMKKKGLKLMFQVIEDIVLDGEVSE